VQQKIGTYFNRRTQSQETAGPSQAINTHGQTRTQTRVAHRLQPILNKNKNTDNVWLESKPLSRTAKSQPVQR
jgi:hypothetical protein